MTVRNISVLLLDLDGTLCDSSEGVTRSMQHALREGGYEVPEQHSLTRFVGPPLHESLQKLSGNGDPEEIKRLVSLYRQRYESIGIFENQLFDGINEFLKQCFDDGLQLLLATAKPEVYATQIIHHFQLDAWISRIYGSELSGLRTDKCVLMDHITTREQFSPDQALMIGDRDCDIVAAHSQEIKACGVSWGYGAESELTKADYIADSPRELYELITEINGRNETN